MTSPTAVPRTRTLFFLHLPKCAGMSLTDALMARLAPDEVYQSTSMIKNVRLNRPEFLEITNHHRLRALSGHWLHEGMLPLLQKPIVFAVSLRDPVARIKSQYRFDHGLRGGNWPRAEAHAFLANNRNVMTSFLRNAFPSISRDYDDPVKGAQAVLSGMDQAFDIADASPRINKLLAIVGVGETEAERTNSSSDVDAHLEVADEVIEEYCALDRQVYDWFMAARKQRPQTRNPVHDHEVRGRFGRLGQKTFDPDTLARFLAPKYAAEIHFGQSQEAAARTQSLFRARAQFFDLTADRLAQLRK